MTKMAAMPIYDKNLIKSSTLEPKGRWPSKLECSIGYYYQFYSSDDPGMTLTYFTARSNLAPFVYVWETDKRMYFFFFFFLETIVVYDIKVGRCSQLNEYMKLYEYQRSRLFIDLCPNHSDSIFLNFFSSITTWPIEAKFCVESPWDEGTKAFSNCLGHMTKMATVPIYGKILQKSSSLESKGRWHRVLEYCQVCSNDAPGLTLTCFTARSNWSCML